MHSDHSRLRIWLTAGSLAVLSLVTFAAQHHHALDSLRTAVHDVLSPGRKLLLSMTTTDRGQESQMAARAASDMLLAAASSVHESSMHAGAFSEELRAARAPDSVDTRTAMHGAAVNAMPSQLQQRFQESELQRRRLMIENARLRNQLRQQSIVRHVDSLLSPDGIASDNGLSRFAITTAQVISSRGLTTSLQNLMIDAGRSAGITRSEIIVEGSGLLLDQGEDERIAAGDRVLAGAVVVGRVSQTGRWVSLVQPVTDPQFSARVQLMRSSSQGTYFGAEGILCGTAEADRQPGGECVINGIPYTEAVSIGDEVVSSEIDGTHGPRLYFGQVTHAEFLDGGQWLIRVRPAALEMSPEHVGIVRLELRREGESGPATATLQSAQDSGQRAGERR